MPTTSLWKITGFLAVAQSTGKGLGHLNQPNQDHRFPLFLAAVTKAIALQQTENSNQAGPLAGCFSMGLGGDCPWPCLTLSSQPGSDQNQHLLEQRGKEAAEGRRNRPGRPPAGIYVANWPPHMAVRNTTSLPHPYSHPPESCPSWVQRAQWGEHCPCVSAQ